MGKSTIPSYACVIFLVGFKFLSVSLSSSRSLHWRKIDLFRPLSFGRRAIKVL